MNKTVSNINKKKRLPKWLKTLIAVLTIIVAVHFIFYFSTKSIVKAGQSINPKATEYFIHANVISTLWINLVHNYLFIDYDSSLMKLLLSATDYFFKKGEQYIKEENAEDAVWWFLTYAYIYNLHTSDRKDNSMKLYSLPKNEEMKLRYKLADYVIKIGNFGVKGVEFGKYESSAMHTFFADSFSGIDVDKHYVGDTAQERINNYWKDRKLYDYRVRTYKAYKKFLKNDKYKDGWELFSLMETYGRLIYLIKKDIKQTDDNFVIYCSNVYINDFFENANNIIKFINKSKDSKPNFLAKNRLENQISDLFVLDILQTSCPKYKNKAKELIEQLKQIKKKGKENGR